MADRRFQKGTWRRPVPGQAGAAEDQGGGRALQTASPLGGVQPRTPPLRKAIADFFQRQPREDINPDEIVAMGAAVQSAILKGKQTDLILLLDVTPFSLGIETEDDTFQQTIERNATIPTRKTIPFTTVEDNHARET